MYLDATTAHGGATHRTQATLPASSTLTFPRRLEKSHQAVIILWNESFSIYFFISYLSEPAPYKDNKRY